ncbi:MAG: sugar transferase [Aquabacterium sp.]|uniref:sugar transferase n=1 Tax=Aquabacterium sp. TaxID=1872578 RepID=UPI0025C2F747|nr:sugar transferase [Aquabacterium sp.]MBI5924648.1 sugar transferase [Aquabacterium sp.]
MSKRLFDWILSTLGLLMLAPVLLLIALAVKLDSPGPVFFRQERVGRYGKPFRIHKFRTMRHEPAGQGLQITVGADSRITRVGGFLRSTKLDELAQLIDVWEGAMSLVGPRPEVPRYVAHYPTDLREKILSVRPGITDIASIEYRDESHVLERAADPEYAYIHEVMPHKLALAASYVDQASVWTDIKLIVRTILAILSK